MKKIFAILFAIAFVFTGLPTAGLNGLLSGGVTAKADTGSTADDTSKSVTVAEGVTEIESSAYAGWSSLESITLPASLTTIGSDAFKDCTNLKEIHFAGTFEEWNAITYDGEASHPNNAGTDIALYVGGELIKDFTVPQDVTAINDYVLANCTLENITISSNVTSIGVNAFENCKNLKDFTIPDSVTVISDGAFCGCDSLESIVIPKSVTAIGTLRGRGYYGRYKLYNGEDPYYPNKTINGAFENCIHLNNIILPDNFTTIGSYTFKGCTDLKSIHIPDSVKIISDCAFSESGLTSVIIPDKIEKFYEGAFGGCRDLQKVEFKGDIGIIQSACFMDCVNLEEVQFDGICKCIGDDAFVNCKSLKSIELKEGLEEIVNYAFENCTGLESITIPASCHFSEADYMFRGCTNLKTVYLLGTSEYTCSLWGAFMDCTSLESVTIAEGQPSIDPEMFCNCINLKTINLPESVTEIYQCAFKGCKSLQEITFSDNLTKIDENAFEGTGLKNITLPLGFSKVEDQAFLNCNNLKTVTVNEAIQTIGSQAFGLNFNAETGSYEPVSGFTAYIYKGGLSGNVAQEYFADNDLDYVYIPTNHADHNFDDQTSTHWGGEANCVSGAYCSDCGKEYTGKNPDNHVGGTVRKNAKEATCSEVGYTGDLCCKSCGAVITKGKEIPMLSHSWDEGTVTEKATCAEKGIITYTCKVCDATKTEETSVTSDHTFSAWTVSVKPTALKAGEQIHTCKVCGKTETKSAVKLTATVKLSASKKSLKNKKSFTLVVSALAYGDSVSSVKSSNTKAVSVKKLKTNRYKITGKKKGKATITVVLKSGKTAVCKVTVK